MVRFIKEAKAAQNSSKFMKDASKFLEKQEQGRGKSGIYSPYREVFHFSIVSETCRRFET